MPKATKTKKTKEVTIHSLKEEIEILTKEIRALNSFRQKFISAVITGFGTVIGATVLVALLIYILTQLASIEIIRPFIESIVNMVKTSYR